MQSALIMQSVSIMQAVSIAPGLDRNADVLDSGHTRSSALFGG
jgi:hypothetical protein